MAYSDIRDKTQRDLKLVIVDVNRHETRKSCLCQILNLFKSPSTRTFPLRPISTKDKFALLSFSATLISNVNQKRIKLIRY